MKLSDSTDYRYAIVTGAASGMGRCYAIELASMGYGVILVDINADATNELSLLLTREHGVPAPVVCIDLTQRDAAAHIVGQCQTNAWNVEVLINNAGMLLTSSLEDTEPSLLSRIIILHCITPLLLCRLMLPLMRAHGKGYILNVSSIAAAMDWPLVGMYGCTKRFVKGYSRALRIECMGTPVSVTTAIFGAVDTPLLEGLSMPLRKLMRRFGLMLSPENATHRALRAMFHRKRTLIPCLSDRIAIMLCPLMPDILLHALWKKYAKRIQRSDLHDKHNIIKR